MTPNLPESILQKRDLRCILKIVGRSSGSTIQPLPGLCQDCIHARRIESDRGSVFVMCQLALSDGRFKKYPRLPVLSCAGYEAGRLPSETFARPITLYN
jgi:hypothetical protein